MKYRPGNRMMAVTIALVVWSTIGLFRPAWNWSLAPLIAIVALLAMLDFRALRQARARLAARRILPNLVGRGQPFGVRVEIQNDTPQAWPAEVRDEVPVSVQPPIWIAPTTLAANAQSTVSQTFVAPLRGKFTFGPLWLRFKGRFGLVEAQRSFADTESVQVYPESLLSSQELAKDAADEIRLLDQLRDTRNQGTGTEFESLEEFRDGDDPRHIDWRTTARYGQPVIRRFQIERHRDVMLLVDCGRLMGADALQGTKLDCAVDAALRLLRIALRGGDRCGLGIFDNQVVGYLRPISGANALPTFLSTLYDLQPRLRETDFSPMFAQMQSRQSKRALVIILSDVIDVETSVRYRTSLATLARRHVVLFAALQTPLLGSIVGAPIRSLEDGFKKSVTFRVLREREQAIHALRRSGVHVLDVEPSKLTAPLINQFIELRRSKLL